MGSMSSPKKDFSLQRVKNNFVNLIRARPILALLMGLLLVVYSLGFFTSTPPQEEEIIFVQNKDFPLESLNDVVEYLRAGDLNLVRPGPSEKTWERQKTDACGSYLDQAYQILATSKSENTKVEAVQVITLCTTDRPKNRARLTTVVKDVPAAIVSLLAPSSSYASKSAAAECIWISSFSSRPNFDALVEAGAVERLSNVIIDECKQKKTPCFVSKMWAAAALQNLAAAYCDSGRCHWEWTKVEKNKRHEIAITNKKIDYNPESLRVSMIRNEKLLKTLTRIICENVKELDKAPSERTWPSRAKVTDTNLTPSVRAWGAIGTIRNLALSPELYDKMPGDLQTCLCAHVVRSPDWLENSKAEDAIYRFGLDTRNVCEKLYNHDTCSDYKDWKDDEEGDCQKYERKRWCAEYRDYAPPKDKKYVTAGEACCACGGGKKSKT